MTKARKFKEEILSLKAQWYGSRYIGDNLGFAYTNTGMYNQFVCKSCGKHSRSRYTINTTKKRKSLLV